MTESTQQEEGPDREATSPEADETAATVEAILFTSDSVLNAAKIARIAELPAQRAVRDAVEALNARYEQMGCVFRIEEIAGGYQMMTLPEYHDVLSRLRRERSDSRLSQAAMETLAIVAYRQAIMRADIEAIRGVSCGEVLRGLLEKQLIKITGRAQVLGRPMLYGTTRRFLEVFGLSDLNDLPRVEELRSGAAGGQSKAQADTEPPSDEEAPPPPTQTPQDTPSGETPGDEADTTADIPGGD